MTRISRSTFALMTASALALAACSKGEAPPIENGDVAMGNGAGDAGDNAMAGVPVSFALTGGDGATRGSVTIAEDPAGLTINVSARGLPVGAHGIHLHEKGLCEGPKFASAGGHWNPAAKKHGRDNPAGAHLGDLANLEVGADGSASVSIPIEGVTTASGANMLADADGTAIVIHAKADDYKTDPSGDSGDRVACAVLAPSK